MLIILIIALGLAMDSFAVSIAGGISLREFKWAHVWRTALFMGVGQALFFVVGYAVAIRFSHLIQQWDHWIAFVLLSGIGLKMIFEHHEDEKFIDLRRKRILFTLAVATSIDALAVGISFSFLNYNLLYTAVVIGVVSFLCSSLGVYLGAFFSKSKKFPTYIVGGVLLIGIGVKILIEHLVNHI